MCPRAAYIALGANLGDKAATLVQALRLLDAADAIEVRRISQFYVTPAEGGPDDQPDYLNAAAEICTTLAPHELLGELQRIERRLGRRRAVEGRWGSRTCDLDLLMMEDEIVEDDELTLPHPRMHERAFVLCPLAEIAPDAMHPTMGRSVRRLLEELESADE